MKFEIYKTYGDVPLYMYPVDKLFEMKKSAIDEYGGSKKAKEGISKKYKCFLSGDAVWRKIYTTDVEEYVDPPVEPKLAVSVIMFRGTDPSFDYISYLYTKGVKINPYSRRESLCFGFYCRDNLSKADEILGELADRKLIDSAMIVNSVWYAYLNKPVNLRNLTESSIFVMSFSDAFKLVHGVVRYAKVAVFHTGTVRILKAPTEKHARDILGRVYALMLKYKAIE